MHTYLLLQRHSHKSFLYEYIQKIDEPIELEVGEAIVLMDMSSSTAERVVPLNFIIMKKTYEHTYQSQSFGVKRTCSTTKKKSNQLICSVCSMTYY
jgi:hypothetical protein